MPMIISASRTTRSFTTFAISLSLALAGCQSQGTDKPSVADPSGSDVGNPLAAMPDALAGEPTEPMEPSMPTSIDASDSGTDEATDAEPVAVPKDETSQAEPDPDTIERTAESVDCGALDPADRAALLERINDARAEARRCGTEPYAAAPALVWDSRLEQAANVHSNDMASNDFFSHTGSDGSAPWDRAEREGYDYRAAAENIAAGQPNAEVAIGGWLVSPGHCRNLMSRAYEAIGMACVDGGDSGYGTYWTQVFAAPR